MTEWVLLTLAGISMGAIYAVISVGWVLVYRVSQVQNLAQGLYVVVAALSVVSLRDSMGWPIGAAVATAVLESTVLSAGVFLLVFNRSTRRSVAGPVIITLGVAIVGSELAARIWGLNALLLTSYLPTAPVFVGDIPIVPAEMVVWGGTVVLFVGGWWWLERTLMGRAMQACAQSRSGAEIVGIDTHKMQFVSFVVAGAVGGIGGVLLVPLVAVSWSSVLPLGIFGLLGAILGRWRFPLAALGSIGIGLFGSYFSGYVSSIWSDGMVYAGFVVVLLIFRERSVVGSRALWFWQR